MADPYRPAPWQQGDILRADELNAMQAGLSPIGTITPWALPFGPDYQTDTRDYSNVSEYAPFHLPCTGGVYANSVAPLLAGAIEHTFVDGGTIGDDGDLISGETLHHIDPSYDRSWIYKRVGDGEVGTPGVTADPVIREPAFVVPDMRGRSPIGMANVFGGEGPDDPVRDVQVGQRIGDWRVQNHQHYWTPPSDKQGRVRLMNLDAPSSNNGSYLNNNNVFTVVDVPYTGVNFAHTGTQLGEGANVHPSLGVNFLIFAGERISDPTPTPGTGGARSGEPMRLHPVTTNHMLRERLADPNLTDEQREYLEARLAGEPWPPPVDEPPATRTTTTTRKAAKRKKS